MFFIRNYHHTLHESEFFYFGFNSSFNHYILELSLVEHY